MCNIDIDSRNQELISIGSGNRVKQEFNKEIENTKESNNRNNTGDNNVINKNNGDNNNNTGDRDINRDGDGDSKNNYLFTDNHIIKNLPKNVLIVDDVLSI